MVLEVGQGGRVTCASAWRAPRASQPHGCSLREARGLSDVPCTRKGMGLMHDLAPRAPFAKSFSPSAPESQGFLFAG